MAEIGIPYQRSLMSTWGALEPEPGKWVWENLDAQWQYLHDRGIETGTLLLGKPTWDQSDPPGYLPVHNLDGWSRYVGKTVTHLRGKTRRFEVWNEPPNFTGADQTPTDYARIVVAAYDAAKKANPDCLVGLTAKSAHIQYLEEVIRAGAADHFDWVSLHPYEILDGIATNSGMEPVYLHIVPTLRKMLASANPGKKEVPIHFTELGVDAVRHGPEAQAKALIKAYAMGIAQGVENIQWFEGRDGDSGPMGLLDGEGNPRRAWHAYRHLIQALGPHPKSIGRMLLGNSTYAFAFEGHHGPVLIAWTPRVTATEQVFPAPVKITNALSGEAITADRATISDTPLFITGIPREWLKKAASWEGESLPWPGAEPAVDLKEAFIEFGDRPIEKGLHTRAAGDVSGAVVAYGGPARAGDIPGGNLFVVDPDFLSYDQVPITITAEVRRKEKVTNAGFKLVYESTAGFRTAGDWYTIPDAEGWHTVRWQIDDPCFVNYWGYNFRLESDGNTYNQYYIRRISVEKR